MFKSLQKRIQAGDKLKIKRRYLVIYLFAGHGVLFKGMQGFLLNDFDESKKFYRILGAEEKIRVLAENFGNSYHIGVFTCCRMLETAVKMSGMLSYAEAKEKYPDLVHDRTDEEEINRIPQPTGPVIEPDVKTLTVE